MLLSIVGDLLPAGTVGSPTLFGSAQIGEMGGGPLAGKLVPLRARCRVELRGWRLLFPHVNKLGLPPPCRTLTVLQLNMQHSGICRDLMTLYIWTHPCDVLLLQDTLDSLCSQFGGLPGRSLFLPSRRSGADVPSRHPLVGVLVKSLLRARAYQLQ